MLARIRDNKTITVISALIRQARELPVELYKTLTWDRGSEMASHTRFTLATDIQIYFCDPHSPWQRGSNENTKRLLRQYFPKGPDLSVHSQQRLNSVARQLNERPRKTLDYESPAERFNQCVAFIGWTHSDKRTLTIRGPSCWLNLVSTNSIILTSAQKTLAGHGWSRRTHLWLYVRLNRQ